MSTSDAPVIDQAVVGKPAPDMTLPDQAGNEWRLRDHLGRPILLVFHRHLQ